MHPQVYLSALTAIAVAVMALYVGLRRERTVVHWLVIALMLSMMLWAVGLGLWRLLPFQRHQEIALVQQEAAETSPDPSADAKPLYHYMLFWARDSKWAEKDWLSARQYIGAFRPTAGFSASDAALAEYVTIVGGPLGVSKKAEDQLTAAGCKVDRIAGKDEDETESILDELAQKGKRFQNFEG